MLKLENVSKSYAKGGVRAVDGLSLEVRAGEVFGFIGPNGAGKTTTIKLITGILSPDEGRITVGGVTLDDDPIAAKRKIGYVPDAQDAYDRLTGLEYLNFMGDIYGVSSRDRAERIKPLAERFELTGALNGIVKGYSRGMKQKLALIGALLHDPPLWVLDEPMVGLDPRAVHVIKRQMRAHCDAGNTVFFSTHVLDVAERLCDRIGILQHGRLIAVGTLDELRSGETGASLERVFLELTGDDDDIDGDYDE
ncbi:MAG: ABC transporter ATP-binding protein [Oscillospiraceae bacterium]|jgi:ABC-2 type transport system ATP-binding protein|nr:ABC transporter ATP-binding protein [Oscillospiraceae bacterium]